MTVKELKEYLEQFPEDAEVKEHCVSRGHGGEWEWDIEVTDFNRFFTFTNGELLFD